MTTEQTDLTTTSDLAKHFKMSKNDMAALLKTLKVPYQTIPFGNRPMAVYSKASTIPIVERALADLSAAKPTAEPAPAATDPKVLEALQELTEKVDNLALSFSQLFEQNTLLLRAHGDTRAEVVAKFDAVLTELQLRRVAALQPALPPAEPAPPPPKPPKHNPEPQSSRVTKPRIAIVGLHGTQQNEIDKEYSSIFDIAFIDMAMANKSSVGEKVARAQSVFLCPSNLTGSVNALVSATGARLVRVNGMSSLRDRLTELYVRVSDKEKAAA